MENNPTQLAETLGGAAAILSGGLLLPELGAAIGIGGAVDAGLTGVDAALASGAVDSAAASTLAGGDILTSAAGSAGLDALSAGAGTATGDVLSAAGALDPTLAASTVADASTTGASSLIPDATAATTAPVTSDATTVGATTAATPTAATPAAATSATPGASSLAPLDDLSAAGGAPAGTTPAAAASAASSPSSLSSILSSPYTKLATGVAPLALTLGMGQPQLPASAQALQGQASALQQQGLQNLSQAQAGVLNAGQTAQLSQMKSDLTNQWRQVLANQGVQDPTKDARWPQIAAQIDAQVTQQTAQLIQQNITNALAETGQASSALTAIAQMQMQSDQNFTNSLIGATKSLGLASGLSSGTKVTIG